MITLNEIRISLSLRHIIGECMFSATRASGPGGQNVNKVSSRVELRFHVAESSILTPVEKFILQSKLASRINNEGYLVLDCQEDRSQHRNKELVIDKFLSLLSQALVPRKKRKPTRPTLSSRIKRLESKKKLGDQKNQRKRPEI
jgi:ribosome-associated protein